MVLLQGERLLLTHPATEDAVLLSAALRSWPGVLLSAALRSWPGVGGIETGQFIFFF
jgi:hypothetical protein